MSVVVGVDGKEITVANLHDIIRGPIIEAASYIKFDPSARDEFLLMALYCSIVEIADAICLLVSQDKSVHAFPLARTQFEAYADFHNLMDDPSYASVLRLEEEDHWVRQASAVDKGNTLFAPLLEEMGPDFIQKKKLEIERLKSAGIKKMTVEQKFSRAGMADIYDGAYRSICSYSHNTISGLLGRHFKPSDGKAVLELFSPSESANTQAILQGAYNVCVVASQKIHGRFRTGQDSRFRL